MHIRLEMPSPSELNTAHRRPSCSQKSLEHAFLIIIPPQKPQASTTFIYLTHECSANSYQPWVTILVSFINFECDVTYYFPSTIQDISVQINTKQVFRDA